MDQNIRKVQLIKTKLLEWQMGNRYKILVLHIKGQNLGVFSGFRKKGDQLENS